MSAEKVLARNYFVLGFPLSAEAWQRYEIAESLPAAATGGATDPVLSLRKLARRMELPSTADHTSPPAEDLIALRTLNRVLRWVSAHYFLEENPGSLDRCRRRAADRLDPGAVHELIHAFVEVFPPAETPLEGRDPAAFLEEPAPAAGPDRAVLEMLLLFLNTVNPAARPARPLCEDDELRRRAPFVPFITGLEEDLAREEPPGTAGIPLLTLLRAPLVASPDSLAGQLQYIAANWADMLPAEMLSTVQRSLDVLAERDLRRGGEPGPPPVLEFGPGTAGWNDDGPEPEAFSRDADWMSNVVLMAKSTYVWLDQLSRRHGRPITTLADVPDSELDRLARWGVTGLWLIGLWERSTASRTIKQWMGNAEAAASAYSLLDYHIAADLGGEAAYGNLRERAGQRGIRLASDMVPNHMGIDSRWVVEHPDWFLQLDHPPYPAYNFTGGDLCDTPGVTVRIEDGYYDHSDAAVVFQRVDENSGDTRYIYHGNDGTSMPWNDTAQLNFMLPEVRRAVSDVILEVARRFPIIRFDAAMTLAKKHYQRLWFPRPGDAGAIPSRAEHGLSKGDFDAAFPVEFWREVVDRIAVEAPDTLLLAEAFWLMEGYFVRTLGMHRVYNSAFMNMLKMEDNQKYRQTIKNVLEFSPEVLKRFVNFMNNPDEKTAVEQFGRGDKYIGCATLLVTMPGLPMLGHGQIEGFTEKYGMEYRKAYWDEQVDEDLVRRHEREIFPLMRRRALFSGVDNFALYDFITDGGWVDENVFAHSNRHGDERALILYNNAYENTRGRVRLASAVNTGPADHPHLEQRSLGQALALDDGMDAWYALRDHNARLEYLRPGNELAHDGFHCELGAYQTMALVGFRRLADGQAWAELAAELGGGGVPDLELALRRRELATELATFRAWLSTDLLGWLERGEPSGSADKAAPALPSAAAELPKPLRRALQRLRALPQATVPDDAGPGTRADFAALLTALPHSRALQEVYCAKALLHAAEIVLVPAADQHLLQDEAASALATWLGHEHAARRAALGAGILAADPSPARDLAAGKAGWLVEFLDLPAGRDLLGVHRHDGVDWLVAEHVDEWLLILAVAAMCLEDDLSPTRLLDGCELVRGAARDAGWRVEKLRQLIDE